MPEVELEGAGGGGGGRYVNFNKVDALCVDPDSGGLEFEDIGVVWRRDADIWG